MQRVFGRVGVVVTLVAAGLGLGTPPAGASAASYAGSCTVVLDVNRQPEQIVVGTPKPGTCVFEGGETEPRVGSLAIDGVVAPTIPGIPFDCVDSHGVGSAAATLVVEGDDGPVAVTHTDLSFGLELVGGAGGLALVADEAPSEFQGGGPAVESPPFTDTCDVAGNSFDLFAVVTLVVRVPEA